MPKPTSRKSRSYDHHWDRTVVADLNQFFQYIEIRWNEWPRRGVTAEEYAEKFGYSIRSARTRLSLYSNYWDEDRQCFRHYLVRVKFSDDTGRISGHYIPGPDWWGEITHRREDRLSGIASCQETNVDAWLNSIGCINGRFDKERG